MDTIVQVPAFEEGEKLADTLRSITALETGDHDVTVEAWVTPSINPSCGFCDTMAYAERVDGVTVFEAPEGKLSARNEAHAHAVQQGADVIVSWDADAPPLDDRALTSLIDTAARPRVAAANSIPVSAGQYEPLGTAVEMLTSIEQATAAHINGQAHALTAGAWESAGPFTTVDETDAHDVRAEEEFRFYHRLQRHGDILTAPHAHVRNDLRRTACLLGIGQESYCGRRGVETFQPLTVDR